MNGRNFGVDQPDSHRVAARDRAMEKASAEAQAYARRAGFRSARLLSIAEQSSFVQPYDVVVLSASRVGAPPPVAAPPPPVLGGRRSVGVAVTAVYRLDR